MDAKEKIVTQIEGTAMRELATGQTGALTTPATSVTEHTTRTLEPAYRERNTE